MSLYDRNYANSREREVASEYSQSALSTFIKQTYQLFAASLLAASVGAYIGLFSSLGVAVAGNYLLFVILELGLLVGLHFAETDGTCLTQTKIFIIASHKIIFYYNC